MMHVTPLREGLIRKKRNEKATIKKPKFEEIWAMFDELYIAKSVKEKPQKTIAKLLQKTFYQSSANAT